MELIETEKVTQDQDKDKFNVLHVYCALCYPTPEFQIAMCGTDITDSPTDLPYVESPDNCAMCEQAWRADPYCHGHCGRSA